MLHARSTRRPLPRTLSSLLSVTLTLALTAGGLAACGGEEELDEDLDRSAALAPVGSGEITCPPPPTGLATYSCTGSAKSATGSPLSGQRVTLEASFCSPCSGAICTPAATKTVLTGSNGQASVTLTAKAANRLVCSVATPGGTKVATAVRSKSTAWASGTVVPVAASYPAHTLAKGQWLHLPPLAVTRATLHDVVATLTRVKGDADLYLRYNAQPTLASYHCRSAHGAGIDESCKPVNRQGPFNLHVSAYGKEEALFEIFRGAFPNKPLDREYIPGEASYSSGRPSTWTIEWDGHEGLDFAAYDAVVRAPFVQNVTNHSATVRWRVSVPAGTAPSTALYAEATIAPANVSLTLGTKLTTTAGQISARVISAYNKYENGVTYNKPAVLTCSSYPLPPCKSSSYWLDAYSARPVVELQVTFNNLQPDTTYHYKVRSQTVNPAAAVTSSSTLGLYTLAQNVQFRTAPQGGAASSQALRFLAMGDLGPGDGAPSYYYDVFDLFHNVARRYGASLWVAMGDIDNDTDGHPNAMDPFFFNAYNAYTTSATATSGVAGRAKSTGVSAFRRPPYLGLLGGLPVYPTLGNHDICTGNSSSYDYWNKAQRQSFAFPSGYDPTAFGSTSVASAAKTFNDAGQGLFYTFRQGDVYFVALGVPNDDCDLGGGKGVWKSYWGTTQHDALASYLHALRFEAAKTDRWIVVYLHAANWATGDKQVASNREALSKLLARYNVDLVLTGHDHDYYEVDRFFSIDGVMRDYRVVVAGTGGWGDQHPFDINTTPAYRPGFVLVEVEGNQLRYWKYDTHQVAADGKPLGRDALDPREREFRVIEKLGPGLHARRVERDLNRAYTFMPEGLTVGTVGSMATTVLAP